MFKKKNNASKGSDKPKIKIKVNRSSGTFAKGVRPPTPLNNSNF